MLNDILKILYSSLTRSWFPRNTPKIQSNHILMILMLCIIIYFIFRSIQMPRRARIPSGFFARHKIWYFPTSNIECPSNIYIQFVQILDGFSCNLSTFWQTYGSEMEHMVRYNMSIIKRLGRIRMHWNRGLNEPKYF